MNNNILDVGTNYYVFAGKTTVYVRVLPQQKSMNERNDNGANPNGISVELPDITFSSDWKAKDGHIECIAISSDDRLVAVGDSMHGLHLFQLEGAEKPTWLQIFSVTSSKRVIKLEFTADRQFLTFLDKQGDIYAVRLLEDKQKVPNIKKIMGHTSFISDYVTHIESKRIVSCDRDEKIRISNFPDAYVIQGFKLGHTESVINISFLEVQSGSTPQTCILSISLSGILLLWNFSENTSGSDTDNIKKWNVKELLPEKMKEKGVKLMKVLSWNDKALLSVAFSGSSKVYIFQVSLTSLEIELLQELETESENVLMGWPYSVHHENCPLIVYLPDLGSTKYWYTNDSSLKNDQIKEFDESVVSDIKAAAESLKPSTVPMKKRLTTFEDSNVVLEEQHLKKIKT